MVQEKCILIVAWKIRKHTRHSKNIYFTCKLKTLAFTPAFLIQKILRLVDGEYILFLRFYLFLYLRSSLLITGLALLPEATGMKLFNGESINITHCAAKIRKQIFNYRNYPALILDSS